MITVLVTAYDVNPFKGSESGSGWNLIVQLSRWFRVIAITRENNRPEIERYWREVSPRPEALAFAYYDLPRWARFWKRGRRGSSLYFYLWQLTMPRFVRRRGFAFDVAHNLNFHADWAPSLLWTLGRPFVWGPISHHPKIPVAFVRRYGWKSWARDRILWFVKNLFWNLDPFVGAAKRRADLVLPGNREVMRRLRLRPTHCEILPLVGASDPGPRSAVTGPFRVISVGRFVPLKGFDVAIEAFARFAGRLEEHRRTGVGLILVGAGPEEARLRALAASRGVAGIVEFTAWMPQHELQRVYREATAMLFPSHEGAGMVVAEALSHGLPVVCFDNCGPGELIDDASGERIPYGTYDETVERFAESLRRLFEDPAHRERLSVGARRRFETWLAWDAKGEVLRRCIERVAR